MTPRHAARALLPLYVGGIYATLGVAREITEQIRAAGWLRATVALVFAGAAAAAATLLARDPRNRSPRVVIGIAGVAALYAAVILPLESPEEKLHFVQYGGVALLALAAMPQRWPYWASAFAAALVTAATGWVDELIQALMPSRYYDLRDVGFNAAAGTMALAAVSLLRAIRTRRAPRAVHPAP